MITVYVEGKDKLISKKSTNEDFKTNSLKENTWIDITSPSPAILKKVAKKTKLNLSFLMSSLDSEESAHADKEDNDTLIVLDVPSKIDTSDKKNNISLAFETIPFIIVFNESYLVTIAKKDTDLIQMFLNKSRSVEPHKHVRTTLQLMYYLAQQFIANLKKIDAESKDVEAKLHSSMKNKELFDLMALNKMLVYFSTALNADKVVLDRLMKTQDFKKFEDDFDLMDDVQIELNQALEMCAIYRDILSGMMDAFASIISNNLNIVMKVLAIVTIVLSVPTLVASFYGMNVEGIPLSKNPYGFWIVLTISIVLSIIAGLFIWFFDRIKKK